MFCEHVETGSRAELCKQKKTYFVSKINLPVRPWCRHNQTRNQILSIVPVLNVSQCSNVSKRYLSVLTSHNVS